MTDEPSLMDARHGIGGNDPPVQPQEFAELIERMEAAFQPTLEAKIAKYIAAASDIPQPIKGRELAEAAVLLVKQINLAIDAADTMRKDFKDPHKRAGEAVDAYFNGEAGGLTRAKANALRALNNWMAAHPEIEKLQTEYGQTAYRKGGIEITVDDISEVPASFLMLDEAAVKAHLKKNPETPKILGLTVTKTSTTIVS